MKTQHSTLKRLLIKEGLSREQASLQASIIIMKGQGMAVIFQIRKDRGMR